MKRKIFVTLIFASLCCVLLSGCFYINIGGYLSCDNYENAESYSVGNFSYSSTEIKKVEINWVAGGVEIVESDKASLTVSEDENLSEDEKLRYLIEGDTLKIQFWKSGYRANIKGKKQKVSIEIPKDADLKATTVSASVTMGTNNLSTATISSVSGEIYAEKLTADRVFLSSVSGAIDVEKVVAQSIIIEETSGNITLNADGFNNIRISAVSSLVRLKINEVGSKVVFDTVSGAYFAPENKKQFGDGQAVITVETVSGNLRITQ